MRYVPGGGKTSGPHDWKVHPTYGAMLSALCSSLGSSIDDMTLEEMCEDRLRRKREYLLAVGQSALSAMRLRMRSPVGGNALFEMQSMTLSFRARWLPKESA